MKLRLARRSVQVGAKEARAEARAEARVEDAQASKLERRRLELKLELKS